MIVEVTTTVGVPDTLPVRPQKAYGAPIARVETELTPPGITRAARANSSCRRGHRAAGLLPWTSAYAPLDA